MGDRALCLQAFIVSERGGGLCRVGIESRGNRSKRRAQTGSGCAEALAFFHQKALFLLPPRISTTDFTCDALRLICFSCDSCHPFPLAGQLQPYSSLPWRCALMREHLVHRQQARAKRHRYEFWTRYGCTEGLVSTDIGALSV